VRRGAIVAEAPSSQATLHLPGRPAATDFRVASQGSHTA